MGAGGLALAWRGDPPAPYRADKADDLLGLVLGRNKPALGLRAPDHGEAKALVLRPIHHLCAGVRVDAGVFALPYSAYGVNLLLRQSDFPVVVAVVYRPPCLGIVGPPQESVEGVAPFRVLL